MKKYGKMICRACGGEISIAGGGVSHYRKHVREGLMEERQMLLFDSTNDINFDLTDDGRRFIKERKEFEEM